MQKISRKNAGVTLAILLVTIFVLIIIVGVSLNFGISALQETGDDRTEIELGLVEQAVIVQYTLLITQNEDDKPAEEISVNIEQEDDNGRPTALAGTRIAYASYLEEYGFTEYLNNYDANDEMTYEEYYYYLDEEDLEAIGIEKSSISTEETKERAYIVNYSTGEVFDVANQIYYCSEDSVFSGGTNSKIDEITYNFTDE